MQCAGRIAFDDQKVAHVLAPVSGEVVRIAAADGSKVAAGDPLCTIRSPELAQATAATRNAYADLIAARRGYAREQTLYAGHAAAARDFEAARGAMAQAEAEYDRARQKSQLLHGAREAGGAADATDTFVLRSPIAGAVMATTAHPGLQVQGQYDAGAQVGELFTVGAIDTVWAIADVFEMDLASVHVGAAVAVDVVAYPGAKFSGQVDWVASAIDPNTRAARVRCRLSNADGRLKPDMYARMRIATGGGEALSVPRRALMRMGDSAVVFVRRRELAANHLQRFERRSVEALEASPGDDVPILHGLEAGDEVVVRGGIILLGG